MSLSLPAPQGPSVGPGASSVVPAPGPTLLSSSASVLLLLLPALRPPTTRPTSHPPPGHPGPFLTTVLGPLCHGRPGLLGSGHGHLCRGDTARWRRRFRELRREAQEGRPGGSGSRQEAGHGAGGHVSPTQRERKGPSSSREQWPPPGGRRDGGGAGGGWRATLVRAGRGLGRPLPVPPLGFPAEVLCPFGMGGAVCAGQGWMECPVVSVRV